MASVMGLYFRMEEEDILEHINGSVICVHFSQLVNRISSVYPYASCNIGMHLKTLLNKFMPIY
jgi:hypothetical protein